MFGRIGKQVVRAGEYNPAVIDNALASDIRAAAQAFLAGRDDDARQLLATAPEPPANPRVSLPVRLRLGIYRRDGFLCRYCSRQTLLDQALQLLSQIAPDEFPFHPYWKRGFVHPAYPTLTPSCDHLVPITRGGAPKDPMNLVTACARCQYSKREYLIEELRGFDLLPCAPSEWDGLTGLYPELYRLVHARVSTSDEPDVLAKFERSHRPWLAALASGAIETAGP